MGVRGCGRKGVGSSWNWGEAGPWPGRGSRGHRGEGGSAQRPLTGREGSGHSLLGVHLHR